MIKFSDYASFKSEMTARRREGYHQRIDYTNAYYLFFNDGIHVFSYTLPFSDTADKSDYDSNYKLSVNPKVEPIETLTGWMKTRPRIVGGNLRSKFIYFITGDDESLDNDGDSSFSISVDTGKTTIDYSPSYDYEVSGGSIQALGDMTGKTFKTKMIMAPDIPEQYGGSWPFIANRKFSQYFWSFEKYTDSKLMKYDPVNYSHKIRLEITYSTNPEVEIEYYLDVYKI